jgi:NO-binding membrane sensor protein with MHYT domain
MLGFDVPASPVRYSVPMTVLSFFFAVVTVGAGLMIVGHGKRSLPKIMLSGVLTGGGVLAMHYTGMAGLHVSGIMHYNAALVGASALIAVVATTVALWFTVSVRGWGPTSAAAAIMAIAVCGMHYTGMAAMQVQLAPVPVGGVTGLRPLTMIVPITIITAATIVGVALSALQAMTEEEFTDGDVAPKRGMHAETAGGTWSLKQTAGFTPLPTVAARRASATRPSPRPVPVPVRSSSATETSGS